MKFAKEMSQYTGKKFKEGGIGPDEYDCVGLVIAYLRNNGKEVPDAWEEWSTSDYFALARGRKDKEIEVLKKWVTGLGTIIDPNQVLAGDIVLIDGGQGLIFPAIYSGKNNAIGAFTSGVRVFGIRGKIKIFLAVRWR